MSYKIREIPNAAVIDLAALFSAVNSIWMFLDIIQTFYTLDVLDNNIKEN